MYNDCYTAGLIASMLVRATGYTGSAYLARWAWCICIHMCFVVALVEQVAAVPALIKGGQRKGGVHAVPGSHNCEHCATTLSLTVAALPLYCGVNEIDDLSSRNKQS